MPTEPPRHVSHDALRGQVAALFVALNVPPDDAALAADVLVAADLRSVESHGVSNYVARIYVPGLSGGSINPRPQIGIVRETPSTALLDGDGGLGMVVGRFAMEDAIGRAREVGSAWVTVRNARHFGMAGYYAMLALEHDMIGLCLTNTGPIVLPTFGLEPMLGTNPIVFAAPAAEERAFVLDMATSTVAMGKLLRAASTGQPIPAGCTAGADGSPTTDPAQAVAARALLPLGGEAVTSGYKGYGLATMVDVLSGVLSGAGFSAMLSGGAVGHMFAAIRIDAFRPAAEFKSMMDEMIRALRGSARAAGQDCIYVAGEREFEAEQQRRESGIPLDAAVLATLRELCEQHDAAWTLG